MLTSLLLQFCILLAGPVYKCRLHSAAKTTIYLLLSSSNYFFLFLSVSELHNDLSIVTLKVTLKINDSISVTHLPIISSNEFLFNFRLIETKFNLTSSSSAIQSKGCREAWLSLKGICNMR